jgi:hypothetical protein
MSTRRTDLAWPNSDHELATSVLDFDGSLALPYSLIEADAVFHNVSLEAVIRRYLAAKLREVGDAP